MASSKKKADLPPFPEFCILPEAPGLLGCSLDKIVQMAVKKEIEISVWFRDEEDVSLIVNRETGDNIQNSMFLDFILDNKVQISPLCTYERLQPTGFTHLKHTTIKTIPEKFTEPKPHSSGLELRKSSRYIKYRFKTAFIDSVITGLWRIITPPANLAITRQIYIPARHFYITPSDYSPDYPDLLFRPRSFNKSLLFTLEDIYMTKKQLEKAREVLTEATYSREDKARMYAHKREQALLGIIYFSLSQEFGETFKERCLDENENINKEQWLSQVVINAKKIFRDGECPQGEDTIRELMRDALLPPRERKMMQNKRGYDSK